MITELYQSTYVLAKCYHFIQYKWYSDIRFCNTRSSDFPSISFLCLYFISLSLLQVFPHPKLLIILPLWRNLPAEFYSGICCRWMGLYLLFHLLFITHKVIFFIEHAWERSLLKPKWQCSLKAIWMWKYFLEVQIKNLWNLPGLKNQYY